MSNLGFVGRALAAVVVGTLAACAAGEEEPDHHAHGAENVGVVSSALTATDPVSAAVTQACSTVAVRGLATQLVEEIQCLRPGSMKSIERARGLTLDESVFPYLQTPAANALLAAQRARGRTMAINSGLRTLPQQYLLYRWYQTDRCGIPLAARPGSSNHESGVAVDIDDNSGWRSSLVDKGFRWLGASDAVHFDFVGGDTLDMKGVSVLAFQRLWNRNHPDDVIEEDSDFGPATEERLAKAPVGGFPQGAVCRTLVGGGIEDVEDDGAAGDERESAEKPADPDADASHRPSGASCAAAPGNNVAGNVGASALGLAFVLLGVLRRRR